MGTMWSLAGDKVARV